ncbi:Uncharacterised protein [Klebsiella pneumoniae]|nr:Uncharacterised protein [Klebsiella pneumoniae]
MLGWGNRWFINLNKVFMSSIFRFDLELSLIVVKIDF